MLDKNIIYTSEINPVDYYNFKKIQECFDLLLSIRNVKKTGIDSFTYVTNKADETKRMVVIENGYFVAKEENGLKLETNKPYTPFMLLQRLIFKNNFNKALNHVLYKHMNHKVDYIRVGVKYYKIISKTDRYNIKRDELKLWDKSIINDDLGKTFLDDIPKYNDFTIVPDNKNYERIVGKNYNLYAPFPHKPIKEKEYDDDLGWHWIRALMEHIFGDQYKLGLKYLKILYENPKQALPILVLTSTERETGKTSFVDFLSILFGDNVVVINPQDISNSFNGAYTDKNIIAIEESKFESTQATEKLKNLSTQKKILVNNKFVQQYSLPFYGKLIITSNDENKFSRVDTPEIRYWVRKIPSLTGKHNHNILNDMVDEIPNFLMHLSKMDKIDVSKSRMVFTAAELKTDALEIVKKESLPTLHKEIIYLMDEHCQNNTSINKFYFTAKTLKKEWFNFNNKYDVTYINRILKDSIKLNKEKMMRFNPLQEDNISSNKMSGRPYVFENKYYGENYD
jgi:hypothetical protein